MGKEQQMDMRIVSAGSAGKVYHRPECRYARKIYRRNREQMLWENAEAKGYRPCACCNGMETLDELMDEERKQYSEQELLEVLQAKSGVTCSGKGSNESGTFKKKILLKDEKNREFHTEISCIPHFKIEKKHSDKRLHFSWGKEEIRKNAIIVVHVGQHWSSENEKEALIKNYIHHA